MDGMGYIISPEKKDPVINQPGFHGMSHHGTSVFSQEFLRTCHQNTQDFCREAFGGGFGVRWCFVVFNDEIQYNKDERYSREI